MYAEVAWVLVSSETQVQPQITLDPDYLPDYLSVSYDNVHIQKFLWSFGFLSRLSTHVFITNCGLNWYVYILELILVILEKLIYDSQNVCGCLTNTHQIDIFENLFDYWQPEQHVITTSTCSKKTVLYIVYLIILCTSTELPFIGNVRKKSLTVLSTK